MDADDTALDRRMGEAARHAGVRVPGHGAVTEGSSWRPASADHAYVDAP
jgi:hypothetical protein